jgi:hypothetical protein
MCTILHLAGGDQENRVIAPGWSTDPGLLRNAANRPGFCECKVLWCEYSWGLEKSAIEQTGIIKTKTKVMVPLSNRFC